MQGTSDAMLMDEEEEEIVDMGDSGPQKPNAPIGEQLRVEASKAAYYEIIPSTLALHPCPIHCVATTKNMKWMFTGGEDGYIRKYDFMRSINGDHNLTAAQRHGLVDSIQNAGTMVSAWEVEEVPLDAQPSITGLTPEATATIPSPAKISQIYCMAVQSEAHFLLAGCESGNINLYTVRHDEGVCQHVLRRHDKPVSVLTLAGDERSVMSGSWDRKYIRWDLETGAIVREFAPLNTHITAIKFKPDGGYAEEPYYSGNGGVEDIAFVLSFDGKGSVVDHRDPAGIVKSVGCENGVPPWGISACWSADGKRVYIGRRNGSVDEWDYAEGRIIQNFRLPRDSGPVTAVQCMPNGRHVACASYDNIRLWDLNYTVPASDTTMADNGSAGAAPSGTLNEFDPLQPLVPFSIISGHHGGTISALGE
ncbi:Transcription factor spt8 [Rhizoclosmatium sp. JEL0117]|nr:Transcription factor spt8 [Rhizoclosmatium sp. JEL0117]